MTSSNVISRPVSDADDIVSGINTSNTALSVIQGDTTSLDAKATTTNSSLTQIQTNTFNSESHLAAIETDTGNIDTSLNNVETYTNSLNTKKATEKIAYGAVLLDDGTNSNLNYMDNTSGTNYYFQNTTGGDLYWDSVTLYFEHTSALHPYTLGQYLVNGTPSTTDILGVATNLTPTWVWQYNGFAYARVMMREFTYTYDTNSHTNAYIYKWKRVFDKPILVQNNEYINYLCHRNYTGGAITHVNVFVEYHYAA